MRLPGTSQRLPEKAGSAIRVIGCLITAERSPIGENSRKKVQNVDVDSTGICQPITLALPWRYVGASLVLQPRRHQTDTKCSRVRRAATLPARPACSQSGENSRMKVQNVVADSTAQNGRPESLNQRR